MASSIVARTREQLDRTLGALRVHGDEIHHGVDVIDTLSCYQRNCREAPARHMVVLPGFAPEALVRDSAAGLRAFSHWCRSQFGQRGLLTLVLERRPPKPARPCPVPDSFLEAHCGFDGGTYGEEYLVLRQGDHIEPRPPPCNPEGWSYGHHAESGRDGWYPPSLTLSAAVHGDAAGWAAS